MKVQTVKKENELPFNGLSAKTQRLWQAMLRFKKVLTSVTLAVVLIVGVGVCVPDLSSPSYALTSKCTLSILNGSVEVIIPGINDMQPGTDGMTLDAGNRVKTSADSTALLTFFDGSTLKLESGTDIEIEQLERNDDQQTITIVLKQWTGETWSHVVKMADRGSHYEIKTPSAVALVRGTQFLTEVDEAGATKVLTTEGLVSVSAQGEEIFLPVGQQTTVEPGTPPSEPETVDISEYIKSQEKLQKGNNGNILSSSKHSNISLNIIPQENNNQGDGQFDDQAEENSQNQGNGQGNGNASAQAAKAEAKASEEAAKDEAKAAEKAAKNEAKAAEETAKAEAKAAEEAAKDAAKAAEEATKAAEEAAKGEAKAAEEAAKAEAKAAEEAAKAEAKAAEEAAKDAAKAAEEAAKAEAKAAEEAAKDATKAAEEATKAEAKAAEEATKAEAKAEEEATKAAEEATKAAEEAAKAEAKAAEKAAKL